MQFATKLASILLAITISALSVRSVVIARHDLAEISAVFFDDVGFKGASYSPDRLIQGVCTTLPGDWLDRPESVEVSSGYSCTFYELQGCEGPGSALSGNVSELPPTTLYNNVESFICTKAL